MDRKSAHTVNFPLWLYLRQPLFDKEKKLVLNPKKFWRLYQIQLLEHCFNLEVESPNV